MQKMLERLIHLRDKNNLSQAKVASHIQTSQQQYSKYEKGESELPVRLLISLAQFYRVSADYLLGLTDSSEGGDALNRSVAPGVSAGAVITDLLALSPESRAALLEQIELRSLKEAVQKHSRALRVSAAQNRPHT